MIYEKQEAPFSIEIDLVEGCFMKCEFCALNGIPEGFSNYKYMSKKTLKTLCQKIAEEGWSSRIVLAGHGEPMKHPHIYGCIKMIRQYLPKNKINMVSNGFGITTESVRRLFDAGLSGLSISEYLKYPAIKKVKQELKKEFEVSDWEDGNIVKNNTDFKTKITIVMPFEYEKKGSTHCLVNRCGVAFPPNSDKADKRCAKPFRDLYISYDGSFLLCCHDFRRSLKLPNIEDDGTLSELWNCPELQAIRKILYHDKRTVFPCNICDNPAYRVGLLPDKKGKYEMAEPTLKDYELWEKAILDVPKSGYKPRAWEPEVYDKESHMRRKDNEKTRSTKHSSN